jgi:ribonuclease HII
MSREELKRLRSLVIYEKNARKRGFKVIGGVDEAGRGPLAGPVVAAVCIIPEGIFFKGINDSKQLTPPQRDFLYDQIRNHPNVVFSLGLASAQEIDEINIYQATLQAMRRAIDALSLVPDFLLVDGMQLKHPTILSEKIIQGDAKSQSIAAASILAKVTRDRMMQKWDLEWPFYGFKQHKGYGTAMHRERLKQHGPCSLHRKSFKLFSVDEELPAELLEVGK